MFNTLVIRDPLNRVAEAYDLDLQDRPVAVTNLEGQVMRVNYGLGSFVRSVTRFDGTTVSNTFDTGGRLTRARCPDSSSVFSWLANDRLSSATNATSRLFYTYDRCGRLTNAVSSVRDAWIVSGEWVYDDWDEEWYWSDTSHYEPVPLDSVRYAYYPAGQVSNVTSAAGSDTWSLDAADRPETLTSARPGLAAATYRFAYNETNGAPAGVAHGSSVEVVDS